MSKLYEKYLLLKRQNPSILYLFKSGFFYIFLAEDAKKMSSLLNLKLTNLNNTVLKCGFPINNLSKYSQFIEDFGYEVHIVDLDTEQTHSSSEYILNSDIKNFIQKLSEIDSNTLSISQAYSFTENISHQAKKFIKRWEMKF